MKKKRVIVWFRNDLRVHDNEALVDACGAGDEVYPVYVFDDRIFKGRSSYDFKRIASYRAKFILESVIDLRENLQKLGADLIIRIGQPEAIIFDLAKTLRTSWVFCNRERTDEEVKVQDALEKNLWSVGQEVRYSRGKMLYYTSDLPFPVTHTPDSFTQFRKEVERFVPVREVLPTPKQISCDISTVDVGDVPTLSRLGYSVKEILTAQASCCKGGEIAGLQRVDQYFKENNHLPAASDVFAENVYSTSFVTFSPYLSQGCLSPKYIYAQLKAHLGANHGSEKCNRLIHGLLLRDYMRLMAKKYGNAIFKRGGIMGEVQPHLKDDMALFRVWAEGRTGVPLVDAAMRQLAQSGFIMNKARSAAASFLVNDLEINWQIGAEYYESMLVDYDPCSNWCSWNYIAGVGNDTKEYKYAPILFQSKKYDPEGNYVRRWIPELMNVPNGRIHEPVTMTQEEIRACGMELGKDYPRPCLSLH